MKAVDLNGGKSDRLGIGLVGFTGGWLVDPAIALRPAAIVSHLLASFGRFNTVIITVLRRDKA